MVAVGSPDCLIDTASPSRGSCAWARARFTDAWLAALQRPATSRKPITAPKDRAVAARASCAAADTPSASVVWLSAPIR